MPQFENEVALVTGAAGGIGSAVARELATGGADLVLADADGSGVAEVAEVVAADTATETVGLEVDVRDPAAVGAMLDTTRERFGRLDVAVNNAAIAGEQAPLEDISEDGWATAIDVNLTGVWRCLKAELPLLRAGERGAVVNVASILGEVGFARSAPYTATKHGVVGLTKTAALEGASDGVRANAVAPGFTETPMLDASGVRDSEETADFVRDLHPQGRFGDPAEIAAGIAWLCSPAASFVTGTTLPIDGGYLAR